MDALEWFERVSKRINVEAEIAGMSSADQISLDTVILGLQAWFERIAATRAGLAPALAAPCESPA